MAISRSASWAAMKIHRFLLTYLIAPLEILLFLYTHISVCPQTISIMITTALVILMHAQKLLETVSLNENTDWHWLGHRQRLFPNSGVKSLKTSCRVICDQEILELIYIKTYI